MFDAWESIGTIAGAGALSYLAASPYQRTVGADNQMTLRLSLDADGSLLGDVRVLGGIGALAVRYWLDKSDYPGARKWLGAVAAASLGSVVITEAMRMSMTRGATSPVPQIAQKLPVFPGKLMNLSYGGLLGSDRMESRRLRAA